ncbi:hypothetical protein X975_18811, partial [Stegodyphus mimosarum]
MKKFEETGSAHNKPSLERPKAVCAHGNIAAVCESIMNDSLASISRRSQELQISQTSLWRILQKYLHLCAYKIQLTQDLKDKDHLQRKNLLSCMSEWR